MGHTDPITTFYTEALPKASLKNNILTAPCPFCTANGRDKQGTMVVLLNPESYFHGYFRCLHHCSARGFALEFARQRHLPLTHVPGFDPDREYIRSRTEYPLKNINHELLDFSDKLTNELINRFKAMGIGPGVLRETQVGYNGRYLVYPYFQQDGNCYAARCVHPDRPEDSFWHGDDDFFDKQATIFGCEEIRKCENGSLILVEGEDNLLTLKQLGLPAIALPTAADFVHLDADTLAWIQTLFIIVHHTPESEASAREVAERLGYKVRLVTWPDATPKGYTLTQLARDTGKQYQQTIFERIRRAKSFSPFSSPEREFLHFKEQLQYQGSDDYLAMGSGFPLLDQALGGIHGINIMGGLPKAGKSSFFIQIAGSMARRKIPVIYYDFENGRQKIYSRILCRLARATSDQISGRRATNDIMERLAQEKSTIREMLPWFRVVTDRQLTPELMRSHIDFLRHETKSESIVIVIDSLHKLPFKDLSKRRTGIDAWLRQFEAMRDELHVSFLIISELTRESDGTYDSTPRMGVFKGSGDIEYSADNAMVLLPQWDLLGDKPIDQRHNDLWLVASREHSPGKIASYRLDYPFWGFIEQQ